MAAETNANDLVKIHADGMKWLIGAGIAALGLCAFLLWADSTLSHSTGEEVLRQTLHELRSAQAAVGGSPVDERQQAAVSRAGDEAGDLPVELTEFEGFHASGAHGHAGSHDSKAHTSGHH